MVEVSPLIGRTSRVSATTFTGRAIAPAQPDPVTTSLINRNSLQLAVVSNQIQGMVAQMNSLAGSLQVISLNISTSQAIERQKEIQEQTLEARLAEQKLQEGKESAIERKIQTAAIAPAQKLASKAQFTLSRLGSFFGTLLGGWLLTKGVETLKALGENNSEKLNEIKNNVLKNLGLITGIFVGYKGGLALLTAAFSRIGGRLLAVSAAGFFVEPFRQFIDFIIQSSKDVIKQIPGLNSLLPKEEPPINPSAPPTVENIESGQAPPEAESTVLPNIDPTQPQSLKEQNGPSIFSPTESLLGEKVFDQESESSPQYTFDFFGGSSINFSRPDINVEPTETVMGESVSGANKEVLDLDPTRPPQYGETSLQAESVSDTSVSLEGNYLNGAQPGQISPADKSLLDMGFTANDIQSFVDTEKYIEKMGTLPTNEIFSPVKKETNLAERVGPAPEQKINVVPIPIANQSQKSPQQQSVASGGINNAPSFPTSNNDNIYVLGAMSNFNVVVV